MISNYYQYRKVHRLEVYDSSFIITKKYFCVKEEIEFQKLNEEIIKLIVHIFL